MSDILVYIALNFEIYQPGFTPLVYRKNVLVATLTMEDRIRTASSTTSLHTVAHELQHWIVSKATVCRIGGSGISVDVPRNISRLPGRSFLTDVSGFPAVSGRCEIPYHV